MTIFKLPLFIIFGKRPVKFITTSEGGMDILAFNWKSGGFKRDLTYLSKFFKDSPEIEEVNENEFEIYVNKLINKIREKKQAR